MLKKIINYYHYHFYFYFILFFMFACPMKNTKYN